MQMLHVILIIDLIKKEHVVNERCEAIFSEIFG